MLSEPLEIIEAFNEQCWGNAPKLDNSLSLPARNPPGLLRFNGYPCNDPHKILSLITVINSLKTKTSVHEVPVSVIKTIKNQFATSLSIPFNYSINNGEFLQLLKHATVVFIHKKGPEYEISNYRPIPLLIVLFQNFFKGNEKKSSEIFFRVKTKSNTLRFPSRPKNIWCLENFL